MQTFWINRLLVAWFGLGMVFVPFLGGSSTLGSSTLWLVAMPALCLMWINAAAIKRLVAEIIDVMEQTPRRGPGARYVRR